MGGEHKFSPNPEKTINKQKKTLLAEVGSTYRSGYRLWFVCLLFLLFLFFCCCVVADCVAALFFKTPAKISKTPQRYSRPREDLENSREVHQDPRDYAQDPPCDNLQEFREDSVARSLGRSAAQSVTRPLRGHHYRGEEMQKEIEIAIWVLVVG